MAVLGQNFMQAMGIGRVHQLLGVGGADSGDKVRCINGALHQVDVVLKGQAAVCIQAVGQAEEIRQG